VRFIHREEANGKLAKEFAKGCTFKPFGRDEQEGEIPPLRGCLCMATRVIIEASMERSTRNPRLTSPPHLIGHERHKGCHDKGEPSQHEGRDLVADTLAPARREDAKRVLPLKDRVDERALPRTKIRVAQVALEEDPRVGR
jgi:hypothetical protein